jgi:hypothetical protein
LLFGIIGIEKAVGSGAWECCAWVAIVCEHVQVHRLELLVAHDVDCLLCTFEVEFVLTLAICEFVRFVLEAWETFIFFDLSLRVSIS